MWRLRVLVTSAVLVAGALSIWACGSFSGSDSASDSGTTTTDASSVTPDAVVPFPPTDAGSSADAADATVVKAGPSCDSAILCDDFERNDIAGQLWTVYPPDASDTSIHIVADAVGNRLGETVNVDLDGSSNLFMLHSTAVPGSSFTIQMDLGWQNFGAGGVGVQYITTCALYFHAPVDGGGDTIAFLSLSATNGISLVFQSGGASDIITVAQTLVPKQAPIPVKLHIDINGSGDGTATVTGLSPTPITLNSSNTKGRFSQKLTSILVGDGYIGPAAAAGVKLDFDNVVVTTP